MGTTVDYTCLKVYNRFASINQDKKKAKWVKSSDSQKDRYHLDNLIKPFWSFSHHALCFFKSENWV